MVDDGPVREPLLVAQVAQVVPVAPHLSNGLPHFSCLRYGEELSAYCVVQLARMQSSLQRCSRTGIEMDPMSLASSASSGKPTGGAGVYS